jgi:hypothetical protein
VKAGLAGAVRVFGPGGVEKGAVVVVLPAAVLMLDRRARLRSRRAWMLGLVSLRTLSVTLVLKLLLR